MKVEGKEQGNTVTAANCQHKQSRESRILKEKICKRVHHKKNFAKKRQKLSLCLATENLENVKESKNNRSTQ